MKRDLIEIKPTFTIGIECLFCQSDEIETREPIFQGMHILVECRCDRCGKEFYHTLPVGHAALFPIAFDKEGRMLRSEKRAEVWLSKPLTDSFYKYPEEDGEIEKNVFFRTKEAILLNCIDNCFGHVFTKLWNVPQLLKAYPGLGVIVLLPKNMKWLVPEGVAEIWTVAAPLHSLNKYIAGLDSFVKEQLSRFEAFYLSPAHVHLDTEQIAIEELVKVTQFSLSDFSKLPPQISFILREDRFSHGSQVELYFYKFCVKFNLLRYFRSFFLWRQNQFFNKVAGIIRNQLGEVTIYATGIGQPKGLSSFIKDNRSKEVTEAKEKEWCKIYAGSHLVIGVHGSNMLIPSSLAAGFIEILPRYKIPNLTEDLVLQHASRYSLFLGRHLDILTSASLLSLHAVSMIKDFPFLYENTNKKVRSV